MDTWATAIYDLGLTAEVFWRLRPCQFAYLVDRKLNADKYTDSRFGMIVSTMINMFVGKKGKSVGPLEVMGYDKEERGDSPSERQQSATELALRMRLLNAAQKRVGVK